jgi:hypothetical protein
MSIKVAILGTKPTSYWPLDDRIGSWCHDELSLHDASVPAEGVSLRRYGRRALSLCATRPCITATFSHEVHFHPEAGRELRNLSRHLKLLPNQRLGDQPVVSQQFGQARGSLSGHLFIGGWRRRMLVGTPAERVGDNSRLGVPPGHAP